MEESNKKINILKANSIYALVNQANEAGISKDDIISLFQINNTNTAFRTEFVLIYYK